MGSPETTPAVSSRPRIFISHKVLDRQLVTYFKDQLIHLGLRSNEIYLSEETKPGTQWNQSILSAMRESDTLVFMYTDPSYDWDWSLFECGYFAGLERVNGQQISLVCINSGIGRPSPLDLWQDISSNMALGQFLADLARRVGSPLLERPAFLEFVNQFWTSIYQRLPAKDQQGSKEGFTQRRLAITVPNGEMEKIKGAHADQLTDLVKVEISNNSLSIFPNAPLEAGWQQFLTALQSQPLQRNWMASIPVMVRMLNATRTESPMLPLVRDGLNPDVAYRPSIAQRDIYGDGSVRYTIVFIRAPEATVASANKTDRAFTWLTLARNFREIVLETYEKKLKTIQTAEDLMLWCQDIKGQIVLVGIDAASRGLNIVADAALFNEVSNDTIGRLQKEWKDCTGQLDTLQVNIAGRIIINGKNFSIETQLSEAKAVLKQMFRINSEFGLHVAGIYFGYVTRPL